MKDIIVPGYFLQEAFVWGATAMILNEFLSLFDQ